MAIHSLGLNTPQLRSYLHTLDPKVNMLSFLSPLAIAGWYSSSCKRNLRVHNKESEAGECSLTDWGRHCLLLASNQQLTPHGPGHKKKGCREPRVRSFSRNIGLHYWLRVSKQHQQQHWPQQPKSIGAGASAAALALSFARSGECHQHHWPSVFYTPAPQHQRAGISTASLALRFPRSGRSAPEHHQHHRHCKLQSTKGRKHHQHHWHSDSGAEDGAPSGGSISSIDSQCQRRRPHKDATPMHAERTGRCGAPVSEQIETGAVTRNQI